MVFVVSSMTAKTQLGSHIVFKFFKFTTSDNLIGWESMPDSANPKEQIFVASMDI